MDGRGSMHFAIKVGGNKVVGGVAPYSDGRFWTMWRKPLPILQCCLVACNDQIRDYGEFVARVKS